MIVVVAAAKRGAFDATILAVVVEEHKSQHSRQRVRKKLRVDY
jgi:hypothetical protein